MAIYEDDVPWYDWDDEPDEEYDENEFDYEECGELPAHIGGGCQLAGTELCDFECPNRDRVLFGEEEEPS